MQLVSPKEHPLQNGAIDGLVIDRQSIVTNSLSGDDSNRGVGVYAGDRGMFLDLFELQHLILRLGTGTREAYRISRRSETLVLLAGLPIYFIAD
jgi:hypothetical protein